MARLQFDSSNMIKVMMIIIVPTLFALFLLLCSPQYFDTLIPSVSAERIDGTPQNDNLTGTPDNDRITGYGGNDTLVGLAGSDEIDGGRGTDTISGSEDDDYIIGGPNNDVINGDAGHDEAEGNDHDDKISGGDGNDSLFGGRSRDIINGEDGDRLITAVLVDQDDEEEKLGLLDRLLSARQFANSLANNDLTLSVLYKGKEVMILGKNAKPKLSKLVTRTSRIQIKSLRRLRKLDQELTSDDER